MLNSKLTAYPSSLLAGQPKPNPGCRHYFSEVFLETWVGEYGLGEIMSLAFIRLYPQDYLSDTCHLTTEEHGAYLLLILNYWQTESPLKDDNRRLAGICRMQTDRWVEIRETIAEFFEVESDLWRHKRIDAELFLVDQRSEQARKAGKIGGQTKARNQSLTSKRLAPAKRPSTYTDTDTDTNKRKNPPTPLLPDWLNQESWLEYVQHRKEIKKPMTALAATKAMAKLKDMANGSFTQKQIIDHSIANGWQGLFYPDKQKSEIGAKTNERLRKEFERSRRESVGSFGGDVPELIHIKET